ncbi:MAG: hypothetical protein FWF56_03430 [Firmicutes bacterium]|nr:hypothetical protein [Bacillota bacterium]MCL1953194.1 hypothetical protein [Bacillota bacterium]
MIGLKSHKIYLMLIVMLLLSSFVLIGCSQTSDNAIDYGIGDEWIQILNIDYNNTTTNSNFEIYRSNHYSPHLSNSTSDNLQFLDNISHGTTILKICKINRK